MWQVLIDKKTTSYFPFNSYDLLHYFRTKLILFFKKRGSKVVGINSNVEL